MLDVMLTCGNITGDKMEPRLYIVMREDLYDNSPGKMMAQAAHAQALFDAYDFAGNHCLEKYCEWRGDGENCIGFGVTLVLSAPWEDMCDIRNAMPHNGMVVDPTYPYRNYYGKMFTSSETTCMWVFATTETEIEFMKKYNLNP